MTAAIFVPETRRTPEVRDLRGSSDVLALFQARTTLPARVHEVHALIRRRLPGAISARTDWMFGFQRRGVRRCERDTDIPKPVPLPHTSHTAATINHSQRIVHRRRGKAAPAARPSSSLTVRRRLCRQAPGSAPGPGADRTMAYQGHGTREARG